MKKVAKKTSLKVAAVTEDPKEIYRQDLDYSNGLYEDYLRNLCGNREEEYIIILFRNPRISEKEFRDAVGKQRIRLRRPKDPMYWETICREACELSATGFVSRAIVASRLKSGRLHPNYHADYTDGRKTTDDERVSADAWRP